MEQDAGLIEAVWWAVEQGGLPIPTDFRAARVQKNGEFYGLYYYADKYEEEWRALNGYEDGELYEDFWQPINGANDNSRLYSFRESINLMDDYSQEKLDATLDNYDIPNVFNFMATVAVLGAWDQACDSNSLQYYDKDKTNRWSLLIWDLDGVLDSSNSNRATPYTYRSAGFEAHDFCFRPVYDHPDLRSLYFRRLRTVVDKLYYNDQFLNKFLELKQLYQSDQELDLEKWPREPGARSAQQVILSLERSKLNFLNLLRQQWAIPEEQQELDEAMIAIDLVNPSAAPEEEFIRLNNGSGQAVDLSGWEIEGINYRISEGVIIPAGGTITFVRDDVGFKQNNNPVLIGGDYEESLNLVGGTISLKKPNGIEVDSYAY
jgi:hypothetical protein